MINRIINLFFPPRCIFCEKILHFDAYINVCNNCDTEINYVKREKNQNIEIDQIKYFDELYIVFMYEGKVKEAIKRFKYFDKRIYAKTFARLIQKSTKEMTTYKKPDIILSVPIHKEKLKKRGFNQSQLISKELSKLIDIPENSNLIKRIINTETQSNLNKIDRISNVKNVFEIVDKYKVVGKNILLIDDILTTGSTVNECSRILKKAGAKSIIIVVIASGNKLIQ